MKPNIKTVISRIVREEVGNTLLKHPDHEGKMAKSELRDMVKLGAELYHMLENEDQLPAWASSYISLASDYIHSVHQYIIEHKNNSHV